MFGTIRKHQQWLWIIVVAGVIISFTAFFSPNQPALRSLMDGGEGGPSIDGRVITADLKVKADRLTRLQESLSGRTSSNDDRAAYQTLLFLEKIRSAKIEVSDQDVAKWIRDNLTDPSTGQFNYPNFLQSMVVARGFTELEFTEFVRYEIGRRHLLDVVGAAGKLVTPREVEDEVRTAHEETLASVVVFPLTNYLAGVQVAEASLPQYYSNQIARYMIPARVVAAYVQFPASNHLAEADAELAKVTDLNVQLESQYQKQGADSFRDEQNNVLTKEAAIGKLKEDQRKAVALSLARNQCVIFYNQLNDSFGAESQKPDANLASFSFENFAASAKQEVYATPPFPRSASVPGFEGQRKLGEQIFGLSAENPFTTPVITEQGVYVFAVKSRIPVEFRPFELVKSEVLASYKQEQAGLAARGAGMEFHAALTNGLAQGKTVAAIAAELGMKVQELPSLSRVARTIPGFEPFAREIFGSVLSVKVGGVSEYLSNPREGGLIIHVKERRPADETKVKAEMAEVQNNLREYGSMSVLQQWVSQEFEKSGLNQYLKPSQVDAGPQ
jgi:hypothetical protein